MSDIDTLRGYNPAFHCGAKVPRSPKEIQERIDTIDGKIADLRTRLSGSRLERSEAQLASRKRQWEKRLVTAIPGDTTPCLLRKGTGTDHPGIDRCKHHCECKGRKGVHFLNVHGPYSGTKNKKLRDYLDEIERGNHDLLDLEPDVKVIRANIMRFMDETEEGTMTGEMVKSLTLLAEQLRRQIETVNTIKLRSAITKEVFDMIMVRMAETVQTYVKDPDTLTAIAMAWERITVDPVTRHQRALKGI